MDLERRQKVESKMLELRENEVGVENKESDREKKGYKQGEGTGVKFKKRKEGWIESRT